jgi:hypothetical protein
LIIKVILRNARCDCEDKMLFCFEIHMSLEFLIIKLVIHN